MCETLMQSFYLRCGMRNWRDTRDLCSTRVTTFHLENLSVPSEVDDKRIITATTLRPFSSNPPTKKRQSFEQLALERLISHLFLGVELTGKKIKKHISIKKCTLSRGDLFHPSWLARFQIIVISQWNKEGGKKRRSGLNHANRNVTQIFHRQNSISSRRKYEKQQLEFHPSTRLHLPFPLPPPPPLILLFLHYIRRSFDLLSRLYACRSFHTFFHPFTIVPFHPTQVIRVQKSLPPDIQERVNTRELVAFWCNYMHFSSNSLSLFLFLAPFSYPSDTRRLSAQEKGFRIPQTTRSPTVLSVASSFPSSPAAKPRLSAKLSPDSPFHPSFPTHETPDEL